MAGQDEVNDDYRDARASHGMKGTVLPSARKGEKEDSGVRFDPKNPKMDQNIVVVDDRDREQRFGVTADEHERMVEGIKKGERADFDQFVKDKAAPIEETKMPIVRPADAATQDDTTPSTEETIPFPGTPAAPEPPPPTVVKSAFAVPPVAPPEPVPPPAPVPPPEPVQAETPPPPAPKPEKVEANQEVRETPKDLNLEPDPAPGPEKISSYEAEKGEKAVPLLQPAKTPGGKETVEAHEQDTGAEDLGEMPEKSVHAPELVKKGVPMGIPTANVESAPMQVQRVKVRFISPLGKLAVPYNMVFRYGMYLFMLQFNEEGMFYDPPQVVDQSIEIWWHGRVFICFPGVYGEFPDGKMAITVFFIDEDKTRARREELRKEVGEGR